MSKNFLTNFEKKERVAYLVTLASLAMADGEVEDGEKQLVETICDDAEIDEAGKAIVISAVYEPEKITFSSYLSLLHNSDLRFHLMTDIILMVYADAEAEQEELEQAAKIRLQLSISQEQYDTLVKYVNTAKIFKEKGIIEGEFLKQAGLEEAFKKNGIPMEAFNSGETVGEIVTNVAISVVEKELKDTKAGIIFSVVKELGLFSGRKKRKKKKKKSKFGKFLAKLANTPVSHA
ncbi:MAG: hypothetical protein CMO01_24110 [Thalassobius sp.]|nr:hypothetical protein [Thalassovita sp.]